MPKRSSDDYVQLKKKITNKDVLNIILILKRDWLLTEQEVCYRLILEGAQREINKRKKI